MMDNDIGASLRAGERKLSSEAARGACDQDCFPVQGVFVHRE